MKKQQPKSKDEPKKSLPKNRKKVVFFVVICVIVLIAMGATAGIYYKQSKDKDVKQQQTATAEVTTPNNQDPLNSSRPTGPTLEQEVKSAKAQIDTLNAEIKLIAAPKTPDEQAALATKYLKLGNLYIVAAQYTEASNALSMIYQPSVMSVETLLKNADINIETQASFGLLFYNMGNYKLAVDAYTRAVALAGPQPKSPIPINADKFKKYTDALVIAKSKM